MNISSIKNDQVSAGSPAVVGIQMPRAMIQHFNEICLKNQKELVDLFNTTSTSFSEVMAAYNETVDLLADVSRIRSLKAITERIKWKQWRIRLSALRDQIERSGEAMNILKGDLVFDDFEVVDRMLKLKVNDEDDEGIKFQITQRTFVQFMYFQKQDGWIKKFADVRVLIDELMAQVRNIEKEMKK